MESSDFRGLDGYLRKEIDRIAGYLSPIDAMAISDLGRFQTQHDIHADLCEFGVHHGRLFFILAHLRRPGEKALAVDLFVDDPGNKNKIHHGRDGALMGHIRRMKLDIGDDEILAGNTLDLNPDDILARIGRPRIISVDAGHLYPEVENDLKLSAEILADNGVLIADDYFNIYWPDVTTATNNFLSGNEGEFVPFLITPGKLYICRKSHIDLYREFAISFTKSSSITSRTVELGRRSLTGARLSRRGEIRQRLRKVIPVV